MKQNNQSTPVKIFLILNIFVGGIVGVFFSWEVATDCGNTLIALGLSGFLFTIFNFFILAQKNMFSKRVAILLSIVFICICGLSLGLVTQITDSTLCGYQFCLGQGVDNSEFISEFKSQSTNYNSDFCSNKSSYTITNFLAIFYGIQSKLKKTINPDSIWSIEEAYPIISISVIAFFSLLDSILLIIYVRKNKQFSEQRLLS